MQVPAFSKLFGLAHKVGDGELIIIFFLCGCGWRSVVVAVRAVEERLEGFIGGYVFVSGLA